jgi:hypothetical protein
MGLSCEWLAMQASLLSLVILDQRLHGSWNLHFCDQDYHRLLEFFFCKRGAMLVFLMLSYPYLLTFGSGSSELGLLLWRVVHPVKVAPDGFRDI